MSFKVKPTVPVFAYFSTGETKWKRKHGRGRTDLTPAFRTQAQEPFPDSFLVCGCEIWTVPNPGRQSSPRYNVNCAAFANPTGHVCKFSFGSQLSTGIWSDSSSPLIFTLRPQHQDCPWVTLENAVFLRLSMKGILFPTYCYIWGETVLLEVCGWNKMYMSSITQEKQKWLFRGKILPFSRCWILDSSSLWPAFELTDS